MHAIRLLNGLKNCLFLVKLPPELNNHLSILVIILTDIF